MPMMSGDQYGLVTVTTKSDDIEAGLKELLGAANGRAKRNAMKRSLKPIVADMRKRVPKTHPNAGENKIDTDKKGGKKKVRALKKARKGRTDRRKSGLKITTKGQTKKGFKQGASSTAVKQKGGTMNLIKKASGQLFAFMTAGQSLGLSARGSISWHTTGSESTKSQSALSEAGRTEQPFRLCKKRFKISTLLSRRILKGN